MKTLMLILMISAGIAAGATVQANESVTPVAQRAVLGPTRTASGRACLRARPHAEAGAALACKKKGESCEDHDECCKWPVWLSCVWGKCGTL